MKTLLYTVLIVGTFLSFSCFGQHLDAEYSDSYYQELLTADIYTPFDETHPYVTWIRRSYIDEGDLTRREREGLAVVRPGMTLRQTEGLLILNGGLDASGEYLITKGSHRTIAVRLSLRPVEMSEALFLDKSKRLAWLQAHPATNPWDAIIERISRPFLSRYVID